MEKNSSSENYTHTTRESPGDRENGRLTLEVSDLEYNLIWVGLITTFAIVEQNPTLKDTKLKKPEILEMVEDVLNRGFRGDTSVSLKIVTTDTQQLTLKCEQKTPRVTFSLTLTLASYKNFTGLIDDVRGALKSRPESSQTDVLKRLEETLEQLNVRLTKVETIFTKLAADSYTIAVQPVQPLQPVQTLEPVE